MCKYVDQKLTVCLCVCRRVSTSSCVRRCCRSTRRARCGPSPSTRRGEAASRAPPLPASHAPSTTGVPSAVFRRPAGGDIYRPPSTVAVSDPGAGWRWRALSAVLLCDVCTLPARRIVAELGGSFCIVVGCCARVVRRLCVYVRVCVCCVCESAEWRAPSLDGDSVSGARLRDRADRRRPERDGDTVWRPAPSSVDMEPRPHHVSCLSYAVMSLELLYDLNLI